MNKKINFFLLLVLCFSLFSCGDDDFPEASELGDLRVLAITADTPQINSAGTVTLTPLISFVKGAGSTVDFSWEACPDPGIDFGADLNCDSSLAAFKLSGNGTFNTNTLSGSFFTGVTPNISLTIPGVVFTNYFNALNEDLKFNGVDYIFIIKYTDQSTEAKATAIKRISLTSKSNADLNTNPTAGNILFNGSVLAAYPQSEGVITLASPSAAQTFTQRTNIGLKSFPEDMYTSWYSSSGEYLFNRTDIDEDNTFTPSGSSGVFVSVYRDGRGGVFTNIISF